METDRTLSEIARAVLVASPETDPRSLREKAGLLALINLLGIVESFYGEGEAVQSSMNLIRAIAENPVLPPAQEPAREPAREFAWEPAREPAREAPAELDVASSIMSLATRLLGGGQGQSGIDPALIGSLMGAISAMSKARSLGTRAPVKAAESEETLPEDRDDGTGEEVYGEGTREQGALGEAAEQAETPKSSPPSALQQILGIDPRIITLALNVLADLMKARNAGSPDRQPSEPSDSAIDTPDTADRENRAGERPETRAGLTVASDGKTVVVPAAKRQSREKLQYKPGLGIYRPRPEKSCAIAK